VSAELRTPLSELKGIGPARTRTLAAAGFERVLDLLFHLPLRYEDRRRVSRVADVVEEGSHTFEGTLRGLRDIRVRRGRLSMVRGWLDDASGSLPVVWFNRPYLRSQVREAETYVVHGVVRRRGGKWELGNPTCEASSAAVHGGRIVPVYPSIGKIGTVGLRHLMARLLDELDLERELPDRMPPPLLERHRLVSLPRALREVHAPPDDADVERLNARRSPGHLRLIYGEFLELQLELAILRSHEVKVEKRHRYTVDDRVRAIARDLLPFRLTEAQKRVLKEIVDDLLLPQPMLRLVQGDVGSGKTIVAALALVVAMESGLQGCFMAPTELLAEQHHRSLAELLGSRYRLGLLTGSSPQPTLLRRDLARGRIQAVVGTHALIQEGVEFQRLGLAVIDEQHRFGVSQREFLQRKGDRPDVLVMTATPIPRSLALTVYGDLALSVIDELPPGRTPIETRVVPESERGDVYRWLRTELSAGAQAYVVFPLIEESDRVNAKSIEAMGEKLRGFLAGHSSAVLHGRTPAEEREATLRRFARGEIQALIATTVIEVGIDVPTASIMIIESAERFGLSQLHQLRGRVGRGRVRSTCVAVHGPLSEAGERRLEVFGATTDGFRIAEADLDIRGPGDLLGTRQAGLPTFRVANIVADRDWLERARADASELLAHPDELGAEELLARVAPRAASRYERFAGG
jgi:ATP-dependent DNA helicase RecG